jgi:hypothetical protein
MLRRIRTMMGEIHTMLRGIRTMMGEIHTMLRRIRTMMGEIRTMRFVAERSLKPVYFRLWVARFF